MIGRRLRGPALLGLAVAGCTPPAAAPAARVEDAPILDPINEVQRRTTGAELSAASAFTLSARIPEGPITVGDVAGLHVYDDTLKALRVSGAQVRRLREATLDDGSPIRPDARYSVTVNDFMAEGGSGFTMLQEGTSVVRTGIVDLDALVDYLRARPRPLPLPTPDRMRPVG
jgi:2',3'-cyclic-nucleotide 2'-phosphodiesterase (5'-nucleotidase family)